MDQDVTLYGGRLGPRPASVPVSGISLTVYMFIVLLCFILSLCTQLRSAQLSNKALID